ncbi:2-oxo acid dehydrogenase subunit E2 [Salmonella sp. s51090]|uniref:2-oxo acid dehydrogenase subunit E2 n=1 Tax=Salmonella sp. s51090 TaxID=3159651 RepID=UPI0039812B6E
MPSGSPPPRTPPTPTLTLSSDARVVDNALAAAFLQSLKSNMENPMRLGLLLFH